jgi:hypothetical protein
MPEISSKNVCDQNYGKILTDLSTSLSITKRVKMLSLTFESARICNFELGTAGAVPGQKNP